MGKYQISPSFGQKMKADPGSSDAASCVHNLSHHADKDAVMISEELPNMQQLSVLSQSRSRELSYLFFWFCFIVRIMSHPWQDLALW